MFLCWDLISGVQMFEVFHWCRYLVFVDVPFGGWVAASLSGSYPRVVSVRGKGQFYRSAGTLNGMEMGWRERLRGMVKKSRGT